MSTTEKSFRVSNDQSDEIDLVAHARLLWAHRLLILATVAVVGSGSVIASFILPKTYTAEATILPMLGPDISGPLAASLGAQLGPAAGLLGGLNGHKSADLVEILNSRSMADRVILRCALNKRIKGWKYHSQLVEKLKGMVVIVPPSIKSKIVNIKVMAPEPELAATIANAYVGELKGMLDEIGYNSAAKNRKFVEHQLDKTRRELSKAEETLATFQAKNRIASLPDTVIASIRSLSDLEAQRIGTEVELKTANETLGTLRSGVESMQIDPQELVALEVKRRGLSAQSEALAKAQDSFLSKLTELPPKAMALARLQRDVQVQNAIYLALRQQYETALVSENKESDSFLPLDRAEAPILPSKPKKQSIIVLGLMAGFVLGIILTYGKVFLKKEEVNVE